MFVSVLLYYFVIKPISLLPHFILYRLSDFLFVIFYYIIPYRKKVVVDNLTQSFPEKSKQEIRKITKKFYLNFTDIMVESLKNFSISKKQVYKRFEAHGVEILDKCIAQGKSVILCGGHFANWEFWAVAATKDIKHPLYALYTKLSNPFFDNKMRSSRGKFGLRLISTKEFPVFLEENIDKAPFVTVFGFDQSPHRASKAVWVNFLGRDTAAQFGPERYSKKHDLPVVYGHLDRTKRGYYSIKYELVTDTPNSFEHGKLLQKLYDILEKDVRQKPHLWLWTHKRWKHKR